MAGAFPLAKVALLSLTMKQIIYFIAVIALTGCVSGKKMTSDIQAETDIILGGKLFAAYYQQQAAEYKALCFQAYNFARLRLDEELAGKSGKPLAIVTDIDETVLDNSPFAVHQALQGKEYEINAWMEWTARAECDTLAGAPSFFKYAAGKGVEVFYITNREESEREGTLKNLQKYGFPFADNEHLILRQHTSSKEARRATVAATHNIVLLLGDNLPDFSVLYDKKGLEEREKVTIDLAREFGDRFIILPNPSYGDWEGALFNYSYQLSLREKAEKIRGVLRNY